MTDLTWQVLPHYKPVITDPATSRDGSMINYENDFTQLFVTPDFFSALLPWMMIPLLAVISLKLTGEIKDGFRGAEFWIVTQIVYFSYLALKYFCIRFTVRWLLLLPWGGQYTSSRVTMGRHWGLRGQLSIFSEKVFG